MYVCPLVCVCVLCVCVCVRVYLCVLTIILDLSTTHYMLHYVCLLAHVCVFVCACMSYCVWVFKCVSMCVFACEREVVNEWVSVCVCERESDRVSVWTCVSGNQCMRTHLCATCGIKHMLYHCFLAACMSACVCVCMLTCTNMWNQTHVASSLPVSMQHAYVCILV